MSFHSNAMSSRHHESDDEGSCDSSSTGVVVSGGGASVPPPSNPPLPPPRGKAKKRSGRSDWEILEGLKEGQTYDRIPKKFEGFILKKRKWPLKGYHKRYFMLEKGVIVYGKSGWDIARGKIHGSLDTGLSVITTKPRDGRVDIDAEDCIYHLKIKPKETYMEWLEQLKQHRLYRQHVLSFKDLSSPVEDIVSPTTPSGDGKDIDKELNLLSKDLSHLQGILDAIPHSKKDKDDDNKRDYLVLAKEVLVNLNNVRGMLRTMGNNDGGSTTLRLALNQALQQNAELKSRLARIHRDSAFETSNFSIAPANSDTMKSYSSSMSNSEYYDAMDNNKDDRTSSDEESFSSEGEGEADSINSETSENSKFEPIVREERRTKLPVAAPSGSEVPSLWGILRKNIGKDLSRISMPVALNEPLGVLQRMCEELEYSELLDNASKESDPIERMAMIAAFAVSGYATAYYRSHKPFNPLHGETFECVREDKGFRFISEQVSHHPPVSAGHAEGRGWMFWEEIQPKTKFWGKSMEIQPIGENHIILPKWGEHYSYNKATTCVHNVFSPPSRWVDLYGEVVIASGSITCNLTFVKVSYWSAKKNEVFGTIVNSEGVTLRNLYGHWNEAFYVGQSPNARCIWRLANMPDDHNRYYGFSRFAIELNELTPQLRERLPITDTRFRPDQRLLEEGNLSEAEAMKLQIEQMQRDRRKQREEENKPIVPSWFRKSNNNSRSGDEQWEFTGEYWELRKNGFRKIEPLW
ncbi:oxysterol-binding protein-related protein 6 isoform X2 [Folsomia candida]|uniref:oxysterol-binding protein-related protein 6 isoform X2 n=1 Tax=Folsomia candida TaxID=158441 RepID=UPI001604D301|nr:oxysterol-binding protein-related protein 6 isoform X2 [Folsomia candida]